MQGLLEFVRFAFRILTAFVWSALASACLVRVPPPNWNNNGAPKAFVHRPRLRLASETVTSGGRGIPQRKHKDSPLDKEDYVDIKLLLGSQNEYIVCDDAPVVFEIPRSMPPTPVQEEITPAFRILIEEILATPRKVTGRKVRASPPKMIDAEFSISTPICSPNRSMYITPVRSLYNTSEVDFTLLKVASERVSEILRENRRKLDSGEDQSAVRREARRRRAQELASSSRKSKTKTYKLKM